MAKKSSTNAIKKIDEQIKKLENSDPKKSGKKNNSSTTKKTSTKISSVAKKTNTKRKTGTSKAKRSSKTKTTKTSSKNVRDKVITVPAKKETVKKSSTSDKNVRDNVVVTPNKKKKEKNVKKSVEKNVRSDVIVADADINKTESKLKSIDKIDENIKKLQSDKLENEELKLDGVIDTEKLDVSDKKKIEKEIEDDINNAKYIEKAKILIQKEKNDKNKIKRKRKGKNKYIIDLEATKEYKNLERDLRSLYDKTNDIIDDIDTDIVDNKTVNIVSDLVVSDVDASEKRGILDYISQALLNKIILILTIVFVVLLFAAICFIVFVSNF